MSYLKSTLSFREIALLRDEHRCVLCGKMAFTVDHIIPLALGGLNTPQNMQALCRPCHTEKDLHVSGAAKLYKKAHPTVPIRRGVTVSRMVGIPVVSLKVGGKYPL